MNSVRWKEGGKQMKKRVLAVLLAATMALSMVACGGSSETEKEEVKTEETGESEDTKTGEEEPEQEEKVAPADDGVINFECDTFKVEYTRHEVGKDWEGNPCLIYYFNFTNKSTEATSAVVSSYFQCFQNGIECETTFLEGENAEYNNLSKDIQQGITIEACEIYKLTDMSEVTIEASDWTSISGEKDIQKITLE